MPRQRAPGIVQPLLSPPRLQLRGEPDSCGQPGQDCAHCAHCEKGRPVTACERFRKGGKRQGARRRGERRACGGRMPRQACRLLKGAARRARKGVCLDRRRRPSGGPWSPGRRRRLRGPRDRKLRGRRSEAELATPRLAKPGMPPASGRRPGPGAGKAPCSLAAGGLAVVFGASRLPLSGRWDRRVPSHGSGQRRHFCKT